jgi:hypothetical protein
VFGIRRMEKNELLWARNSVLNTWPIQTRTGRYFLRWARAVGNSPSSDPDALVEAH